MYKYCRHLFIKLTVLRTNTVKELHLINKLNTYSLTKYHEFVMKILITGGTGLIGRAFIEHKLGLNRADVETSADACDIIVFSRNKQKAEATLPNQVKVIDSLADIHFSTLDVIINLAGEPIVNKRWTDKQKHILCQSRWQLTEQLVNKINKECNNSDHSAESISTSPIRFISGSAVGVYGRQPTGLVTETHNSPFPEFAHKLCQQWEDIALQAKPANVALLRTGIVLSSKGGALEKMRLPFKLGLGGKVASGEQFMPWIHIDDMVRGIDYLIAHPVLNGPFNLTAPHPVTNKQFSQTYAQVLRRPCVFPMPEFVLRLAMGEMADLLIYGQNAIPESLVKAGFRFDYEHLDKALQNVERES